MSDDTDFPTCETCEHAQDAFGPDDLLFCGEGVTAPLKYQQEWGHDIEMLQGQFVTPNFGCILHSALDHQDND